MKIRKCTSYHEYSNTYHYTDFEVIDKLPVIGETFNRLVVKDVREAALDWSADSMYQGDLYTFHEIVCVDEPLFDDDQPEEFSFFVAVAVEDETEEEEEEEEPKKQTTPAPLPFVVSWCNRNFKFSHERFATLEEAEQYFTDVISKKEKYLRNISIAEVSTSADNRRIIKEMEFNK